jgi:mxaJ protein
MPSLFRRTAALTAVFVFGATAPAPAPAHAPRVLRICADPNNLPFSNVRGEGFENRLAALVAQDLGARPRYTWWAQRRGFLRSTLNAGLCDIVMGVPSGIEQAWASQPYYRSTYVFLTRRDRALRIASFDDPALRQLRIGVQLIGDDYANSPPAHALARRGLARQLVGYSVLGNYAEPNPPARIVDAVARGDVDIAVVWGPLAGYFARRQPVPLDLVPVQPQIDPPALPFVFDIAVAFRRGDTALRAEVEEVLDRRRPDIDRLLAEYGVPRVDALR